MTDVDDIGRVRVRLQELREELETIETVPGTGVSRRTASHKAFAHVPDQSTR